MGSKKPAVVRSGRKGNDLPFRGQQHIVCLNSGLSAGILEIMAGCPGRKGRESFIALAYMTASKRRGHFVPATKCRSALG